MTTAVILLGFDVTHAVFTLTTYRPSRVIVFLASVKGRVDPRSLIAYSHLEQIASAIGAKIERVEVEVTNPVHAVSHVRSIMEPIAKTSPLVMDLGGGLRLLIVETLLAYLSLPSELRENSRLVVYIEGSNEAREILPADLKRVLLRKPRTLSYAEECVLKAMEEQREYTLEQVHKAVLEGGLNVSKQYVLKILRRLAEHGFVVRTARGRYMKVVKEPA